MAELYLNPKTQTVVVLWVHKLATGGGGVITGLSF